MSLFSPAVRLAVTQLSRVVLVRISDGRSLPRSHVSASIPSPAWRAFHPDVYLYVANGHVASLRLSPDRLSFPWKWLPFIMPKRRGRRAREDRRALLARTSLAPRDPRAGEANWDDLHTAELWYCHATWTVRETDEVERAMPRFVFATPAVNPDELYKFDECIDNEILNESVDPLPLATIIVDTPFFEINDDGIEDPEDVPSLLFLPAVVKTIETGDGTDDGSHDMECTRSVIVESVPDIFDSSRTAF
ncbi:hypothetical protein K488DRAFT_71903 [Vararia minispora EC-137]|uniref:Uncharacterized protein n=1 Tax=Vararia minispora EC-137 TaxID=1314806 RepID=A0ACB8QG27_9AGAM|nr:hypothetical protein K488DRAFT_71903 [Vararia minispora EC-137]